jgi:tetratricopeptide (TPR) repeat protein
MASVSRLALGLMLGLGLAVPAASPAAAQDAARGPSLTKQERSALAALETALNARNYAGASSALSAAQSAARGSDARYYLAQLQLKLARETGNRALEASATEALIASGRVPQAQLGALYAAQASFVPSGAQARERTEAALTRALELSPSAETALALAQAKISLRKNAEAVALVERAIQLRKASGVPVPESWYRRGIDLSTAAKLAPQTMKFTREWIAAYPTRENWRDAILLYRENGAPDAAALLDASRLARLSKALSGERDYMEAAQGFSSASLPGESRSLWDEAVSTKMVDPAKPAFKEAIAASAKSATAAKGRLAALKTAAGAASTGTASLEAADQYLSFGDYSAAADLYRAALTKGAADPNVANTRLGIALALAGRQPEAEAAFRAVNGPRAELAALWLVWLGQRAG